MALMDTNFTCIANQDPKETAIDVQLENVINKKYTERNVMIWIQGHFFNHIGYYTSLYSSPLHKKIGKFTAQYVTLPDPLCNDVI